MFFSITCIIFLNNKKKTANVVYNIFSWAGAVWILDKTSKMNRLIITLLTEALGLIIIILHFGSDGRGIITTDEFNVI